MRIASALCLVLAGGSLALSGQELPERGGVTFGFGLPAGQAKDAFSRSVALGFAVHVNLGEPFEGRFRAEWVETGETTVSPSPYIPETVNRGAQSLNFGYEWLYGSDSARLIFGAVAHRWAQYATVRRGTLVMHPSSSGIALAPSVGAQVHFTKTLWWEIRYEPISVNPPAGQNYIEKRMDMATIGFEVRW